MEKFKKYLVIILLLLAGVFGGLMYLIGVDAEPALKARAFGIAKMTSGLIILWIYLGGFIMYRKRDRIRDYVRAIPGRWQVKFVLFCILLACLEEAVTVSMTNLAPVFGSKIGEAYITASANYFDVIFLHSVIVFVPLFIALAYLLSRYDFKPFSVFMAFGFVGTCCEAMFAGSPGAFVMFPMWLFVYGLMVYLPTYSIPENRGAKPVNFIHYLLIVPAIFIIALPMVVPIGIIISGVLHHPAIDFPH